MKKTIFSRILKGYFLVTVTLALFITLAAFLTLKNYYLANLKSELIKNTELLVEIFLPDLKNDNLKNLAQKVKVLAKQEQLRITIVDLNGQVLVDSAVDAKKMENHATRPEVMTALSGGIGYAHHLSETLGKDMIYIALPVRHNNQIIKVVRASIFVKDINQIFKTALLAYFWGSADSFDFGNYFGFLVS